MDPLQAHLTLLLHELAHGPDLGETFGHFSDPGAGLLPALAGLNSLQVSAPVAAGRPSPAAYVAHLAQQLTFAAGQLQGAVEFPDFAAPWGLGPVDEAGWLELQGELAAAFARLQAALHLRDLEPEELHLAQTALTHAATHAGALRFHAANLRAGA